MSALFRSIYKKINLFTGFTLTEALVTISVMAILGSVGMWSVSGTMRRGSLDRSAREVISAIKKTQTMALAGVDSTGVPPFHYGVYFDSADPKQQRYIIYANQDSDPAFDTAALPDGNPNTDDQREVLNLNENSVEFVIPPAPDNFIAFAAPSGRVVRSSNFQITLRANSGAASVIIVDFVSGLVYEQ